VNISYENEINIYTQYALFHVRAYLHDGHRGWICGGGI